VGLRRIRESIFAADPDLELAVRDPLEELRRMLAKQFRGMDVVEEDRVADLDAPGQAHDIEWPRTAQHRAIPAEGARAAQDIERPLKRRWSRSVINDMDALSIGQAQPLFGKSPFRIDNDMVGTRLPGGGDLLLR